MTTPSTTPLPFTWLEAIEPRLVDKTSIPYPNSPEAFSMKEMADRLGGLFHLSVGNLSLGDPQRVEDTTYPAADTISYGYRIGNLPGNLYWLINRNEAERLIILLLKGKQEVVPDLDPGLLDAFMRYLSLEILLHLRALGFHDSLLIECIGAELPSSQKSYVRMPLSWSIQDANFASSLLLPEDFTQQWNQHFRQEHHTKPLSETLAKQVDIVIHLDVGTIHLSQKEWEETQIGDFLLFDHCTLIPGKDKGRVRLSASNIPLFRAMVKEGSIKLLEYSTYQEMEPSMSKKLSDDATSSHDEPLEKEEELDEGEVEDEEEDDDEDLEEETNGEEEEGEEEEDEEELEDEESEEGEEEGGQEEEELEEDSMHAPSKKEGPEKPPLTPMEQIPLTLNVEVGRIKMNLAQLRQLEPGQILDLSVNPAEGVELVIEGRTIGRGELLRLGESIGVRITELG